MTSEKEEKGNKGEEREERRHTWMLKIDRWQAGTAYFLIEILTAVHEIRLDNLVQILIRTGARVSVCFDALCIASVSKSALTSSPTVEFPDLLT